MLSGIDEMFPVARPENNVRVRRAEPFPTPLPRRALRLTTVARPDRRSVGFARASAVRTVLSPASRTGCAETRKRDGAAVAMPAEKPAIFFFYIFFAPASPD